MLRSYYTNHFIEAGCDEAGRGSYAGPVFAAAVILPNDFFHPLLNDSKKVKELDRKFLRGVIEKEAIRFSVAMVDHIEIDRINILKASFKAMHHAIDGLNIIPDILLIDGNRFIKYKSINHECIIRGDGVFTSIAAASILAKTYRDDFMSALHLEYPDYNWRKNKGYGTLQHRKAIEVNGLCFYHRKSYNISPYRP